MKENKVTTYVDEALYKWLDSEASKMGLTISAYVRFLLLKASQQNEG